MGGKALAYAGAGLALACVLAPLSEALAQTSPRIVPTGRPDQNAPASAAPLSNQNVGGGFPRARAADAAIAPFQLTGVDVVGSSLSAEALQAAYAPFIGQQVDNAVLSKITTAVAAQYAHANIALYTVLVPEQRFEGGRLQLVAVEGFVDEVAIRGHVNPRAERLIARYLAPIRADRPLRTSTLQRYASLIRDIPGLYPSLDFERGSRQGAVRLVVKAEARAVQLALGVNNRGTALLGRTQAEADVFVNSLLVGGDQVKATLILPTEVKEFQFYGLAYAAPIDADGTTIQANLGYLRTRPKSVPLEGSATSFGVQLTHPFIRSFNRNLYGTVSLDGVNSDNALLGTTLSNDRTRAVRIAASYALQGPKNSTTINGSFSQGIDSLGARTLNPGGTDLSFQKFNAKLIDNLLLSRNIVLRLDGFAQATGDRLPASEQIALGGDEFGRAYESALVSGDYGYAGSAEVAYRPGKRLPKGLEGSEVYIFTDGGKVYSRGRNGYPGYNSQLASIGGGVRAQVVKRAVVQVEAVRGLYNPVFYENREVWRLLFSVRTAF